MHGECGRSSPKPVHDVDLVLIEQPIEDLGGDAVSRADDVPQETLEFGVERRIGLDSLDFQGNQPSLVICQLDIGRDEIMIAGEPAIA